MGGNDSGNKNTICYCTIATTGNFADFGDLYNTQQEMSATSNPIRSVINRNAEVWSVTIMTLGNSVDFGTLTVARDHNSMMSNAHGVL